MKCGTTGGDKQVNISGDSSTLGLASKLEETISQTYNEG